MKKITQTLLPFLLLFTCFYSYSQAPGKFNYQAVIRDANGNAFANQSVPLVLKLYNNGVGNAPILYQESFAATTNANGIVNLQVGTNPSLGPLSGLDWSTGIFYVDISINGTSIYGGGALAQLVSVPYSLYATNADTASYSSSSLNALSALFSQSATSADTAAYARNAPQTSYSAGTGININGTNQIVNTAPDQIVAIAGQGGTKVTGSYPTYNVASPDSLMLHAGTGITITGTYPNLTISSVDLTPAGTIVAFGGTVAPTGWLLCDGSPYSTTGTYANLYAAVKANFGGSGGIFNVPDFRGRFLRGADSTSAGAANIDLDKYSRTAMNAGGNSGSAVGSVQADALVSHTHSCYIADLTTGALASGGTQSAWFHGVDQPQTGATGGSETRPKNAYVNYIIKY